MSTENNNEPQNETPVEDAQVVNESSESSPEQPASNSGQYTMGMLCHLLSFIGYIGVPFGNILGPLILWLVKKDQDSFVDENGKEVLNFQISAMIYGVVCFLLTFVFIGLILLPILIIGVIVYTIIAAIKANEGIVYRYPYSIRFIK